jgi:hypothetical protein
VYRVFGCAVAVVLVDSGDYVTYVVGLEECCHLLVQIFGSLVGSECFWMSSQLNDQAAVRVDEVVLVGKKLDVLGAGIGAHEDHEVFVSAGGLCGYLAAEVAVDVFPWDCCSVLLGACSWAVAFPGLRG